jgi:sugar lactone lactonase YvrE
MLVISVALVGCGGGGGGSSAPPASSSTSIVPPAPDSTPNAFSFNDQTNAARGADITTTAGVITGINVPADISITGGQYAIGGGDYTASPGTITNGNIVRIRLTASSTPGDHTEATLTIGGVSATFRVTTSQDVTPPTAAVVFPPTVSRTGGPTVTVRGTANDASGPLAAVRVNGVPATSTDGFANWQAVVPLDPGTNTLTVEAEDSFLNVQPLAAGIEVHRNARVAKPWRMTLDTQNNRAFVIDLFAQAVIAVDLATGVRTWFADTAAPGQPREQSYPTGVALDTAHQRLLVLDSFSASLIAIDLQTRQRTILSSSLEPAEGGSSGLMNMALDNAHNRALIIAYRRGSPAVLAVDLESGARTVFSDATRPNAANQFSYPDGVALDAAHNRILVVDSGAQAIIAVDLTTGARGILSSNTLPDDQQPLTFSSPQSNTAIAMDIEGNRALVPILYGRVVAVDLNSGQRTLVWDSYATENVLFNTTQAIAVDGGRILIFAEDERDLLAIQAGAQTVISPNDAPTGGFGIRRPTGLALDLPNRRALVADAASRSVISLDLASAVSTRIIDGNSAPFPFANPRTLVFDASADQLYIQQPYGGADFSAAIFRHDLTSGLRQVVSPLRSDSDVTRAMAADSQRARLFITERIFRFSQSGTDDFGALIQVKIVDPTTGEQSLLGKDIFSTEVDPTGIVIDDARNRAIILNAANPSFWLLLAVDLATGEQSILARDDQRRLVIPNTLALDSEGNRALIADNSNGALAAVNLSTGAITALTDTNDPDNPISGGSTLGYDPERQTAYLTERNFGAVLAIDTITGRRVYVSQ